MPKRSSIYSVKIYSEQPRLIHFKNKFSQITVVHQQNIAENQCSNQSSLISYSHGQFLLLHEGLNKKEKCKRQESSKLQFFKFSWVNSGRTGTSNPKRQPDLIIYKPLTSFPSRHSRWESSLGSYLSGWFCQNRVISGNYLLFSLNSHLITTCSLSVCLDQSLLKTGTQASLQFTHTLFQNNNNYP